GGHSPSGRSTGAEKQKACSKAGFLNFAPGKNGKGNGGNYVALVFAFSLPVLHFSAFRRPKEGLKGMVLEICFLFPR
ncbi:hypothetical protein, partial [Klebsiella pneumoniae]|uniref:hypothetical protein n=1 Tax=Klebsiella pneumoniae TaxID=573 RepID=UPI0013E995A9